MTVIPGTVSDKRVAIGSGPVYVDACERCGVPFRTYEQHCEKTCPNCGHRTSCHD